MEWPPCVFSIANRLPLGKSAVENKAEMAAIINFSFIVFHVKNIAVIITKSPLKNTNKRQDRPAFDTKLLAEFILSYPPYLLDEPICRNLRLKLSLS